MSRFEKQNAPQIRCGGERRQESDDRDENDLDQEVGLSGRCGEKTLANENGHEHGQKGQTDIFDVPAPFLAHEKTAVKQVDVNGRRSGVDQYPNQSRSRRPDGLNQDNHQRKGNPHHHDTQIIIQLGIAIGQGQEEGKQPPAKSEAGAQDDVADALALAIGTMVDARVLRDGQQLFLFSPRLLAFAIAFSVILGGLAATYATLRIVRLSPAEAIRRGT